MQPHLPAQHRQRELPEPGGHRQAAIRRVMGIWRTLKPLMKNPWLEVRYEDMVDDLESVARQDAGFSRRAVGCPRIEVSMNMPGKSWCARPPTPT